MRKDVERAFGVLKKQWKIVFHPLLKKSLNYISLIVEAVLILHNMNVEDRNVLQAFPRRDDQEEEVEVVPITAEERQEDFTLLSNTQERLLAARRQAAQNIANLRIFQDQEEHDRLTKALKKNFFKGKIE